MEDRTTGQARALALAGPAPPDIPVRVDVAMTRRAAEYQGPATPGPSDTGGDGWEWRKPALA